MRFVAALFKLVLVGAGVILALGFAIIGVFAWSHNNVARAHGSCAMRIMENKIGEDQSSEYRRACMKSHGYLMTGDCFVRGFSTASCFVPRWAVWIEKIDF
ncbi:hypothetical protein [Aminobacter sp. MDW-2]|uniref:hypothetical protein n=1 Tax=Aminobacter sp. MDW-2 TaxID=2666139 RepID=UPI0012AF98DC|nr:hypothetical protein [Aminobacter sp. MDW-2]MRX33237.1 hypothetical protein [Aminobacter sp. MDW-2]QNH36856.1 hypothetical protein H5P29_13700 [Aminobacter sp. MDW-2]